MKSRGGYHTYIIVVDNIEFGFEASGILSELFPTIAERIGSGAYRNLISNIIDERGIQEAKRKFKLDYNSKWPVLLIMQKHPDELERHDKIIKIELGNIREEDAIKRFLSMLANLISDNRFATLDWEIKKGKIKEIAGRAPIIIKIIGVVIGAL